MVHRRWDERLLHLGFQPDDHYRAVARLVAHGAQRVDTGQGIRSRSWLSDTGCGAPVTLEYEAGEQDGYSFRAIEVWSAGDEPHRRCEIPGARDAYTSSLTITLDDPKTPDPT